MAGLAPGARSFADAQDDSSSGTVRHLLLKEKALVGGDGGPHPALRATFPVRGEGLGAPHPPQCAHWGTFSSRRRLWGTPSVSAGAGDLIRPFGPPSPCAGKAWGHLIRPSVRTGARQAAGDRKGRPYGPYRPGVGTGARQAAGDRKGRPYGPYPPIVGTGDFLRGGSKRRGRSEDGETEEAGWGVRQRQKRTAARESRTSRTRFAAVKTSRKRPGSACSAWE